MHDYVKGQQEAIEYDKWFREQVQQGLDEANAGHLIPGEEVEEHFAAKRTALRRRIANKG